MDGVVRSKELIVEFLFACVWVTRASGVTTWKEGRKGRWKVPLHGNAQLHQRTYTLTLHKFRNLDDMNIRFQFRLFPTAHRRAYA